MSTGKWFSSRYFTAIEEDVLPFHANSGALCQFLLPDCEAREIVEPTKQALDKITRVAGFWIAGVRMPADRV
ncbi:MULTISPECIES: hypothetical protein [Bradyrhizobium]|uniref:hypothetical protein n=1 Tax=Bradyrhizobium elkanii TaxID=29448 RepID=UPI0027149805|nr:hypothetical protein [Bradyrhizobium elkanii]WLA49732.1 hypothetical protein QIH80_05925 [Bradyrhizobium elkanii]WLB80035.1 hypothetical protein QIH83_38060 [Bradyrhizobium elkanii]